MARCAAEWILTYNQTSAKQAIQSVLGRVLPDSAIGVTDARARYIVALRDVVDCAG